jgi:Nuclease-related domain
MTSSQSWPFDDEDRPSGSVRPFSQADLQAILAHLGDDSDELLAGTIGDRPVVAVRVRASVGRPGGSAQAQWRRLRAAEWAAWARTVPWRVAAILVIATVGGLLGSLLAPRLGLVFGGLVALVAGWGLRFRPSPDASAWQRGAAGERRTARLLAPLERDGWVILHDLAVPGSRANLDHLVIGPGGVFVIDSKQYRGRLQLDPSGRLWHGRYPLAPTLRAADFEADQAARALPDPGMAVVPIVAVHGAQVPWGQGGHAGCPGGIGQAPAKHASRPPAGAGVRTGRRPGRPGPLPRRRLICNPCRALNRWDGTRRLPSLPRRMLTLEAAVTASRRPLIVAGRDAPWTRAASLASSAARVVHPISLWPRPSTLPESSALIPTRITGVPSRGPVEVSPLVIPPRGASRPQEPRPTGPPRGSGAATPQGALRAIDPCGAAAPWGGPVVRAACGGI